MTRIVEIKAFSLSNKEFAILSLILKGKSSKNISIIQGVSTKTIEQHKQSIRKKLVCRTDYGIPGAISRAGLTPFFLRQYRRSIRLNTGYLHLSDIEIQLVQHLIYDLNLKEVLALDKFSTLSRNATLIAVCKKAETKHYFELVAILVHHGLVKLPVPVRLNPIQQLAV